MIFHHVGLVESPRPALLAGGSSSFLLIAIKNLLKSLYLLTNLLIRVILREKNRTIKDSEEKEKGCMRAYPAAHSRGTSLFCWLTAFRLRPASIRSLRSSITFMGGGASFRTDFCLLSKQQRLTENSCCS